MNASIKMSSISGHPLTAIGYWTQPKIVDTVFYSQQIIQKGIKNSICLFWCQRLQKMGNISTLCSNSIKISNKIWTIK